MSKSCIKGGCIYILTVKMDTSRRVSREFIRAYIGKGSNPLSRETQEILKHVRKVVRENLFWFNNLSFRLKMRKKNAKTIYKSVVQELFNNGFNWGRVIALFAFSGYIAKVIDSEEVINWLQDERISRNNLIIENGDWISFMLQFDDRPCWLT